MSGVTTEVGRLRTVVLHRPGDELKRITPRNSVELLFDGVPWLERARVEHDAFAALLADHGVEILYLTDLLTDVMTVPEAREAAVHAAVTPLAVGPLLSASLRDQLLALPAADLVEVLVAGLSFGELERAPGVPARMARATDFVVPPLPNLMFTRDSSVWLADRVAVTAPSTAARVREVSLTGAVYRHHPRFAGVRFLSGAPAGTPGADGGGAGDTGRGTRGGGGGGEGSGTGGGRGKGRGGGRGKGGGGRAPEPDAWFEGGDVLLLSPGVVAVGVGQRTRPAGVEQFAQRAFAAGVAHTVLAVPIAQERATMHLDTVCTMVDVDAAVMYPPVADSLQAYVITPANGPAPARDGPESLPDRSSPRPDRSSPRPDRSDPRRDGDEPPPESIALHVSGPQRFLSAAAAAMGIEEIRVIGTGLDPVTAEREQWDDGNNTLCIAPRLAVAYERNVETNARLEAAGIEVLPIAGSELGSGRGGPRCMSCPVWRDPPE